MTTAADTDLDWVTFTDKQASQPCEYGKCSSEALYVVRFRIIRGCTHPVLYFCVAHKDVIVERATWANGFFTHRDVCPDSLTRLDNVRPLRKAA